ncbi:unnamed protein product [Gongylonema pulchrum]|uniref:Uncharacterized protein n=1 Tax=Gongylonema pulchrum TaxID=637853 RepID=A0A3P7MBX6_9BILA|nr:unnamed protein product [Gongylonema pulchrum]
MIQQRRENDVQIMAEGAVLILMNTIPIRANRRITILFYRSWMMLMWSSKEKKRSSNKRNSS